MEVFSTVKPEVMNPLTSVTGRRDYRPTITGGGAASTTHKAVTVNAAEAHWLAVVGSQSRCAI